MVWNKFKKDIFNATIRKINILDWENMIVVLNEYEAHLHGINQFDKVTLLFDWQKIVVDVSLSADLVQIWEIGVFQDVFEKYNLDDGDSIWVYFAFRHDVSVEWIKKRLKWEKINDEEIYSIIKDISKNKLTDTLITYYAASNFVSKASKHELYITAKAMAETWDMIKFDWIVADKHCIGGIPGNETSMIVVPIIASLGITIPKVFSKAITSPAATWECVDVLMDIIFKTTEIKKNVKKNNACLIWWWGLNLAPADDKIIKISYPLAMQSFGKMISSILAKQYAMWINHCLIDIPVWPTAKISDITMAKRVKKEFEYVGNKLGMKMSVEITSAFEPIGRGVGAKLQVREVLRILQWHDKRSLDLEKKALFLASKLVELVGMAKWKRAYKLVEKQLRTGAARKKMQDIMSSQHAKAVDVNSEDFEFWEFVHHVKSSKSGKIKSIDLQYVNTIARSLWCPLIYGAGIYFEKKLWDNVVEWDVLYTLYSLDEHKLEFALSVLSEKDLYEIN